MRDPDEYGIAGRVVWIDWDGDGALDINEPRDATDENGNYALLHLGPAAFPVRQRLPDATWSQTLPAGPPGGAPTAYDIALRAGQQAAGIDFGSRSAEPMPPNVTGVSYGADAAGTPRLRILMSGELAAGSLQPGDLVVTRRDDGQAFTPGAVGYDGTAAVFSFPDLPGGALAAGEYAATLRAGSASDVAGNPLAQVTRDFAAAAVVADRHVFYNNSAFDGKDPAANPADDAAIAPDKLALRPGEMMGFANYTSYARGINGMMIDLAGLPPGTLLLPEDFDVRAGTSIDARRWSDVPAPAVTFRPGAGAAGSDRVTLTWADGNAVNRVLRVTVLPTPRTRLAASDVFYFSNVVGETGNLPFDSTVNAIDLGATRLNQLQRGVPLVDPYDFNRDGNVNAIDLGLVRANQLRSLLPFRAAPPRVDEPADDLAPISAVAGLLADI